MTNISQTYVGQGQNQITFFRSLRGRLLLLFLSVAVVPLAVLGVVAITQLNAANAAAAEVSENYLPSIVNLDEVPHNVTLSIAGKEKVVSLLPHGRWQSNSYPIKVQYDGYQSPALDLRGSYAIWKGGTLSLQKSSRIRRGGH